MFGSLFLGLLASNAIALPANAILPRATVDINKTELEDCPCRDITFIWARASTETGNMGGSLGPLLCEDLKADYDEENVACQGVGGAYAADLISNTYPLGTSQGAIDEALRLFDLASTKCPDTQVVAGGYSQGTAVMAASISVLEAAVQEQIAGVVLFGYTRNSQNSGRIPSFSTDRALVYCNEGDQVCYGTLNVTQAHFEYEQFVPAAAQFLEAKLAIAN
ncbi:carbohydrate esterase family 5 protein [Pseudocercospora fijiensis CIRAD86]|uniref:Cutinase n=1 Tax=Pseudocercospora fijiensis (strain CIRAD86) TaxID=383855 RepID=N1Q768_PSEFD|nr:carbohydrate esterase family 5 protein [Pseudocercospora fijiensis CIRAD86]EME88450.1 carbohydrate esterase family 5 protein [Pseudocercospora fijiensis CIRAD86]